MFEPMILYKFQDMASSVLPKQCSPYLKFELTLHQK